MQLSAEERVAVESGRLVRYVIPESQVECLVVRSDKLDQLVEHPTSVRVIPTISCH